ncbi:MAG: hypothetical protein H5U24_11295 [Thioclava marina]|jgi:hypothetical protein|uniref:Uncharacterized protein n=1 Tax=Thioclava marina TaxID=1915077 RepID=A0ABX3ML08_9RHOB|nr:MULTISPECIES: hypothetical protein [Thioclava]TNE83100.1 MAG: hypothetical protein EP337_17380 [Paracoccaceae bacterium]MBC7145975.1 hypothetical protein [Thioclava marina]OOY11873.1 hypothetical protein BMG00_12385 [Thioclava marina]OOY26831.1 hypothetical protein BMI90_15525 [Thioclava sp. L04-15]TNF15462.1 MAG: hypothetical protein EP320_04440 [Paracoccaceae bacterium]
MSRKTRNRHIAMLSPLAFALAFGAYAGSTQIGRETRLSIPDEEIAQVGTDEAEELGWLTDWLERHGQA